MEEIRPPEESYTDRLQNPDSGSSVEREPGMEEAMMQSMVEYEHYLADMKLRKEKDRIKKYAGDCVVQKAVLLMIDYKLRLIEKYHVSEYLTALRAEGRLEDVYRYLQTHVILPANYIGTFLLS